jgi:hypothetical protein
MPIPELEQLREEYAPKLRSLIYNKEQIDRKTVEKGIELVGKAFSILEDEKFNKAPEIRKEYYTTMSYCLQELLKRENEAYGNSMSKNSKDRHQKNLEKISIILPQIESARVDLDHREKNLVIGKSSSPKATADSRSHPISPQMDKFKAKLDASSNPPAPPTAQDKKEEVAPSQSTVETTPKSKR